MSDDGEIFLFLGFALAILLGGVIGGFLTRDTPPSERAEKRRKFLLHWLTRRG